MPLIERDDWITATTDKAHAENWAGIHTSGFCKACANVYTALNHVATTRGAVSALRELLAAVDAHAPFDTEPDARLYAAIDAARTAIGGQ